MLLHLTAAAAAAGDSAPVSASIAVTAITTIGVVLVALITSFRRRDTGPNTPDTQTRQTNQDQSQLSGGGSVHAEDSRQNERLAVLEYQQKDSRDRIRALERRAGIRVSPENEENEL